MKIYCLWFLLNIFERIKSIDYCSNEKHFLCGNDCLRPPKLCKRKYYKQVEINEKHISDMLHNLNTLRNQIASGTFRMKIWATKQFENKREQVTHKFTRGFFLNEVVSDYVQLGSRITFYFIIGMGSYISLFGSIYGK